jgi:3-(3-hydroxy-phenyl)propionate hydroxylase
VKLRGRAGDNRRLFDAFRDPRHCLVVFSGDASEATVKECTARVRESFSALVGVLRIGTADQDGADMIDIDATAHARYGAHRGAVYLVRPDGYVGFRGSLHDGDALLADLQRRLTC